MWSKYQSPTKEDSDISLTITFRTLAGMFPNLDKDIIDDVVRVKQGRYSVLSPELAPNLMRSNRVGLAVDACLALNT